MAVHRRADCLARSGRRDRLIERVQAFTRSLHAHAALQDAASRRRAPFQGAAVASSIRPAPGYRRARARAAPRAPRLRRGPRCTRASPAARPAWRAAARMPLRGGARPGRRTGTADPSLSAHACRRRETARRDPPLVTSSSPGPAPRVPAEHAVGAPLAGDLVRGRVLERSAAPPRGSGEHDGRGRGARPPRRVSGDGPEGSGGRRQAAAIRPIAEHLDHAADRGVAIQGCAWTAKRLDSPNRGGGNRGPVDESRLDVADPHAVNEQRDVLGLTAAKEAASRHNRAPRAEKAPGHRKTGRAWKHLSHVERGHARQCRGVDRHRRRRNHTARRLSTLRRDDNVHCKSRGFIWRLRQSSPHTPHVRDDQQRAHGCAPSTGQRDPHKRLVVSHRLLAVV